MEERLRAGLEALGLPTGGAPAMARHARLLLERNRVMDLTAITGEADVAALHFLDSAALATELVLSGKSVLDVGAGAGFPGLVLRLVEPSVRLTLLDAQRKRVDFLREICEKLALSDVACVHARAEEFGHREAFDVVVSRAVAALPVLAELCLPLTAVGGVFAAMKSVNADAELSGAERAIRLWAERWNGLRITQSRGQRSGTGSFLRASTAPRLRPIPALTPKSKSVPFEETRQRLYP